MSPSEDSTEGERERLLSETNSKTRSHSGEDAGIGSEQGEFQLPLELRLGKQVIDLQGLNLGFISVQLIHLSSWDLLRFKSSKYQQRSLPSLEPQSFRRPFLPALPYFPSPHQLGLASSFATFNWFCWLNWARKEGTFGKSAHIQVPKMALRAPEWKFWDHFFAKMMEFPFLSDCYLSFIS